MSYSEKDPYSYVYKVKGCMSTYYRDGIERTFCLRSGYVHVCISVGCERDARLVGGGVCVAVFTFIRQTLQKRSGRNTESCLIQTAVG